MLLSVVGSMFGNEETGPARNQGFVSVDGLGGARNGSIVGMVFVSNFYSHMFSLVTIMIVRNLMAFTEAD